MNIKRRRGGPGPVRYSLFCFLAVAALSSGCVSAPKEAPGDSPPPDASAAADVKAPADGSAPPASASAERPEVLEIRRPLPLPVRIAALLPDPEPKTPSAPVVKPAPVPAAKPAAPPKSPAPPAASKADAKPPPAKPEPSSKPAGAVSGAAPAAASAAPAAKPAPTLPPAPASSARVAPEPAPAPGRSETAVRGSPLELPFRGSGWVYLGETGGRDGLRYDSRRYDGSSAVFVFTAERSGEYQLKFQRQDPFSGEPENLLVKVVVREPEPAVPAGSTARAPAAPAASAPTASPAGTSGTIPASGAATSSAAEAAPASAVPALPPTVPRELPSTPEALLRLAREDLAAARIAGVLEALDRYLALFPFGSDEAHYLYGKAYEQNTPYRDIKKAYANYRKVRDEWPRSPFWKESSERVMYIERHYFDIR